MRIDGPAAPNRKNGAKNTDIKALLLNVQQKIRQRHWRGGPNKPRGIQSAAPAHADEGDRIIAGIEEIATIGKEFKDIVAKGKRLSERQPLSADECKELAATTAEAKAAAECGRKRATLLRTMEAEIMATARRHVDKLLSKVDKLAARPEETERFRAGIGRAKKMTGALDKLHKHVENSCAWLGSASSITKSLESKEGLLRLIKMRDERLAKNARVEYIDGKKYTWAPGTVANQRNASISSTFAPTPNRYGALNDWDDEDCAETASRVVHFEERGARHPTREEARPSKDFKLPPSVRAQTTKGYHTQNDRRNSERELLADSEAIKEFLEVKEMPDHQEKVVVQRRKIGRRPRQAAGGTTIVSPPPSPLPFTAKAGPTLIADTGCSASGIIAAKDSAALALPNLGPSVARIRDANGGTTNATGETLIRKNEVTGGIGKAIMGLVQRSLEGVGQYADEGFVIVYHDAYNGVSVHQRRMLSSTGTENRCEKAGETRMTSCGIGS